MFTLFCTKVRFCAAVMRRADPGWPLVVSCLLGSLLERGSIEEI